MSVVGFDFGNHTCKIAVARKGAIDVIMNDCSNRNTPSVVGYTDTNRQVGEAGLAQSVSNFKNTAYEMKRILGRSWGDAEFEADAANLAYKIVRGDANQVMIEVNYNNERSQLTPEQVTGALFTHLKQLAERALETKVCDCVIGVPPFATDKMRRAFIDAASIAGLNVLRLMNESAAIALQYGLLRQLPESVPIKILFFDMGHSQTTVTLCSFIQGSLTVLATASHRALGGRDFDRIIVRQIVDYAKDKYKLDLAPNVKAMLRVSKQTEKIKKMLSANLESPYNIECIMNDVDVKGSLNRDQYEAMCAPLLEQMLLPLKEVLAASGVESRDIDAVEVVGGASRVPSVRRVLKDFLGCDVKTTCNADESVARGCALQCAMLSPSFRVREFAVNDITNYSITLGWGAVDGPEDESANLFTKLQAIPSIKQIQFTKNGPFAIQARYTHAGDFPAGADSAIARFVVSGLPEAATRQKIKIRLDTNGLLSLTHAQALEEIKDDSAEKGDVMEVESNEAVMDAGGGDEEKEKDKKKKKYRRTELNTVASYVGGFSAAQVAQGVEVEATQANQDRIVAETAEKRNDLESYIYEIRNDISAELAPYILPGDADRFTAQLMEVEDWLSSDDGMSSQKSEYVRRLVDLKAVSDPVKFRRNENQNRATSVNALKASLQKFRLQASSPDAKFAHIDASEKGKIVAAVVDHEAWLERSHLLQATLPLTADPVLTTTECESRRTSLERLATPILSKPAPAPTPAPAAAAAPSPAAAASPAAEAAAAPEAEPHAHSPPAEQNRMDVD